MDRLPKRCFLWGYRGTGNDAEQLSYAEAKKLLVEALPLTNMSAERQRGTT